MFVCTSWIELSRALTVMGILLCARRWCKMRVVQGDENRGGFEELSGTSVVVQTKKLVCRKIPWRLWKILQNRMIDPVIWFRVEMCCGNLLVVIERNWAEKFTAPLFFFSPPPPRTKMPHRERSNSSIHVHNYYSFPTIDLYHFIAFVLLQEPFHLQQYPFWQRKNILRIHNAPRQDQTT